MTKLTNFLNLAFKDGIPVLNVWLKTQPITIPTVLFGLFKLSDLTLKYHNGFLEMGLTPTFLPPSHEIPDVYYKFVPEKLLHFYNEEDVFEEFLDEDDTYSSKQIRAYSLREIFGNQVEIYKRIPNFIMK